MKTALIWGLLISAALADLPAGTWKASENFGGKVEGTWLYNPATRSFQARWRNGSEAVLRLQSYDGNRIVITRTEATGPTAGLNVRYEGTASGDGFTGQVLWTWADQARRGTWSVQLPPPQRKSP